MPDIFDSLEFPTQQNETPTLQNKKTKRDIFDTIEENEENSLKGYARTALQVPQGIAEGTTYGLVTGLAHLIGAGELNDPEELDRLRYAYYKAGKEFDEEEYFRRGQEALDAVPTISNIGSAIEKRTGLPLEPKTRVQKALRFGSGVAKALPAKSVANPSGVGFRGTNVSLPRPIVGVGTASISQILQEAGIPEPFADIISLGGIQRMNSSSPSLNIGKSKKDSGLTKRRFENLEEPLNVSPDKLNQINTKIEKEFREITNKIIEDSPVSETNKNIKNDIGFKQKVQSEFGKVEDLAETLPDTFRTENLKSDLQKMTDKYETSALTPSEFDKAKKSFIDQFIKETPDKDFTAKEIVAQYRKNNKQLGEVYEPGQSFAYNRAKREALLDYNNVLADMIEKNFPDSQFSNLFKETNKQWADIINTETVTNFVDDLFVNNVNFKKAKDLFTKNGMTVPFEKALGKEGFEKFKNVMNDLLSYENGYKLLKTAQAQGLEDLVKTGKAFLLHPSAGQAKFALDVVTGGYKSIMKALLDKPQLAITWDKGINAFKSGNFKVAEKEFSKLTNEVNQSEKVRVENLKKFNEKIQEPVIAEKNPEVKAAEEGSKKLDKKIQEPVIAEKNPEVKAAEEGSKKLDKKIQEPVIAEKNPELKAPEEGSKKLDKNTKISKNILHDYLSGKPVGESQKKVLKNTKVSLLNSRGGENKFHGSRNRINDLSDDIYFKSSPQNIYGPGFYTSDALDIADGYSKAKFATNPTVYNVSEKSIQKIYNAEKPIKEFKSLWDKSQRKTFEYLKKKEPDSMNYRARKKNKDLTFAEYQKHNDSAISEIISDYKPKNVRELYDNIRSYSSDEGLPLYEMQEIFDSVQTVLESNGYEGLSHKGGLLTNNPEHKVTIYWKPENLDIKEFAYPSEFKKVNKLNPHKSSMTKPEPKAQPKPEPAKEKQKPSKTLTPKKLNQIERQDISKKGLKQQKEYIIDHVEKAIKNKSSEEKIRLNVPGDGKFILNNNVDSLGKFLERVKSKWPDKPLKFTKKELGHPNKTRD